MSAGDHSSRIPDPGAGHPREIVIDLDFRPTSYADAPDPVSAIVQNLLGQQRREDVRAWLLPTEGPRVWEERTEEEEFAAADEWKEGRAREAPPALRSEDLEDRLDPRRIPDWIAGQSREVGERLPPHLPGEVEIVRFIFDTGEWLCRRTVACIRARLRRHGGQARYHYRIVNEERPWRLERKTSLRPLTLRELVHLIDTIDEGRPRNGAFLESQLSEYHLQKNPEEAAALVRVESSVYPMVGRYYARRMLAHAVLNQIEYG